MSSNKSKHEQNNEEIQNDDHDYNDDDETVKAVTVFEYNKPLFVCVISPISNLVAVGSEDEKAYLCDTGSKELVHTIEGHTDSVTCMAFSKNGNYLATGDMEGNLQVLDIATFETVWKITIDGDLMWLLWIDSKYLMAGSNLGEVWLWLMPSGHAKLIHSSGTATQVATLSPDGKLIAVGYDDGIMRVIELKTRNVRRCVTVSVESPLTVLSFHINQKWILFGTANGTCKIISWEDRYDIFTFLTAHRRRLDLYIEAAQFCPHDKRWVVVAQDGGNLYIFDMEHPLSYKYKLEYQVTSIVWHPTKSYFYTACLNGTIQCFDVLTGKVVNQYGGHTDVVLDIAIKHDATLLMSVSDDNTARIFTLGE